MSRARAFFLFFALLAAALGAPLAAEDKGWVLAAEKFSVEDIPPVYEGVAEAIPQLILSRVGNLKDRAVLPDEQKSRELAALSQSRMKLITERAALVLERDKVLLSADGSFTKRRNRAKAEKAVRVKEKEISALDGKIQKLAESVLEGTETENIELWESGSKLYSRASGVSLGKSLVDSKISGLITGTVKDLAGYLLVTAQVETGIRDLPAVTVTEAAPYDELDGLVSTLTARLLPELSMKAPVVLELSVTPESSVLFVDSKRIEDFSVPVTVFSGEHSISVSAEGYRSAIRTYDFAGADAFRVSIELEVEPTVSVAFDTGNVPASVYFHTRYLGETPFIAELPAIKTVGEVTVGDVKTFFIFDPAELSGTGTNSASIRANVVGTKDRIEKRRRVFYGSLAALYLSIPLSMISYGINVNMATAYEDDKIAHTQENLDEIRNWYQVSTISRGVTIGLGLNVAFQLFRYILAAEQAVPKYTENNAQENGEY